MECISEFFSFFLFVFFVWIENGRDGAEKRLPSIFFLNVWGALILFIYIIHMYVYMYYIMWGNRRLTVTAMDDGDGGG